MQNTRAPIELPARILDFCRLISSEQPSVMTVEPLNFAVQGECYSNVEEQVRRAEAPRRTDGKYGTGLQSSLKRSSMQSGGIRVDLFTT